MSWLSEQKPWKKKMQVLEQRLAVSGVSMISFFRRMPLSRWCYDLYLVWRMISLSLNFIKKREKKMSNLIRSKKSNNLEVKFQQEYIYLTANPKKCSPLVTSSKILQTNQRQCRVVWLDRELSETLSTNSGTSWRTPMSNSTRVHSTRNPLGKLLRSNLIPQAVPLLHLRQRGWIVHLSHLVMISYCMGKWQQFTLKNIWNLPFLFLSNLVLELTH